MAFHYSPNIITDGLVLYLDAANTKSYISGSTTWNDISRGVNNGTLTNGSTYNSLNGGNIFFDGIDDFVLTDYMLNPQYFTFECIYKLNSVASTTVTVGKYSGIGDDYWMGYYTGSNDIVFSTNGNILSSGVIPSLSSYYVVTCVISSTSKQIFINGVLKNSTTTISVNPNGVITLAKFGVGSDFYAPCNITSFKFYERALSSSEILQNYNTTKSRFGL